MPKEINKKMEEEVEEIYLLHTQKKNVFRLDEILLWIYDIECKTKSFAKNMSEKKKRAQTKESKRKKNCVIYFEGCKTG